MAELVAADRDQQGGGDGPQPDIAPADFLLRHQPVEQDENSGHQQHIQQVAGQLEICLSREEVGEHRKQDIGRREQRQQDTQPDHHYEGKHALADQGGGFALFGGRHIPDLIQGELQLVKQTGGGKQQSQETDERKQDRARAGRF